MSDDHYQYPYGGHNEPIDHIPFGKYKRVPIEDVPTSYLAWVIDNLDPNKNANVYELCEAEYIRRKNRG